MRKKIVAGNWKMNKTLPEGKQLIKSIIDELNHRNNKEVKIVLAPSFVHLQNAVELVSEFNQISVAAQNCSDKSSGAYTGEVSAEIINSVGCEYVIIGHSERRLYYLETNNILSEKVNQALNNQLHVIFCCGESIEERNDQKHFEIIKSQLTEGLFQISDNQIDKIVIAYEPVWAIGTGLTASPEQAQEMHQFIRIVVSEKFGEHKANNISILYGGSCSSSNAKSIFNQKDVDGGLIGGASLKSVDFVDIINSF